MGKKDIEKENLHDELDEQRKKAASDEAVPEEKTAKPKKKTEKKKEEEAPKEPVESEADKLKKQLDASMDAHVRTLAEYDNYRKRTSKEREAAYGDAKADVLKLLLPVMDNIDRATQSEPTDFDAYKKGAEMIFNAFSDALTKAGLEQFGQAGDKFDPKLHNAVMHIEDESLDEDVITDVFSKGYKLGDRILRTAMVKVAN